MARIVYTDEHIEFLRSEYQKMNVRNLTKAFNTRFDMNKPQSAIASLLYKRKIKCGRIGNDRLIENRKTLLTPEQAEFVRSAYKKMTSLRIAHALNKKYDTDFKPNQIRAYLRNHKIKSGRTGCFEKGSRPWNAGVKGSIKANSGSFKPGNVPATIKPLYSERISKDGTIEIKVPVPHDGKGASTRYMPKQRWIYEQHNGSIPDGYIVTFKDGDNRNFAPENLIILLRAEMLQMNINGYRKMPDEIKPSVLALSKLQVKTNAVVRGMS